MLEGLLLSVFRLVLAPFSWLLAFPSLTVAAFILPSSTTVVLAVASVATLFVLFGLLSWFFLRFGSCRDFGEGCGLRLNSSSWSFFHLFHNSWCFNLRLRLRDSCDNHGSWFWLRHNWCGGLFWYNSNRLRLGLNFLNFFDLFVKNVTHNFFFIADDGYNLSVSMLFDVGGECLLEFSVVGEVLEGVGEGVDGVIEGGKVVGLFEGVPEVGELVAFGEFGACVEEGDGAGEDFELSKLIGAIEGGIFGIGVLEESGGFLNAGAFLEERSFAIDLLHLFGLEILLGL